MKDSYRRHTFQKDLSVTDLISLFDYESPKDFCFDGEAHDFWEFIYIDKGKMLITAGEQQYVLKSGELAFHCPGEFHAVQACSDLPSSFIVCAFVSDSSLMKTFTHKIMTLTGPALQALRAAVREAKGLILPVQEPGRVTLSIPGSAPGTPQLIQSYLEQMLLMLYRQSSAVQIQRRVETFAQQRSRQQLASNIQDYLKDQIGERQTLAQIARATGYSVAQIKKIFKSETGQSPMDWFIDLKMEEARRMIREGDLNFGQISARLGYDNPHYFSRLFHQRHHMTMTEYARSYMEHKLPD